MYMCIPILKFLVLVIEYLILYVLVTLTFALQRINYQICSSTLSVNQHTKSRYNSLIIHTSQTVVVLLIFNTVEY